MCQRWHGAAALFTLAVAATFGSAGANPPGCECIGAGAALTGDALRKYGSNYGQWCAAWDDGICTSGAQEGPRHPCDGTHSSSCDKLWPELDWRGSDQLQCCDAWCFVNASTCNATAWGIDMKQSAINSTLSVSYGAKISPGARIALTVPQACSNPHWTPLPIGAQGHVQIGTLGRHIRQMVRSNWRNLTRRLLRAPTSL